MPRRHQYTYDKRVEPRRKYLEGKAPAKATPEQRRLLRELGCPKAALNGLTKTEASELIDDMLKSKGR